MWLLNGQSKTLAEALLREKHTRLAQGMGLEIKNTPGHKEAWKLWQKLPYFWSEHFQGVLQM